MRQLFALGFVAALMGIVFCPGSFSQAGALDPSFDSDGIVIAPSFTGSFTTVAVDSTRGIVAGGSENVASGENRQWPIVRYHANGTLDTLFGLGGIVRLFGTTAIDRVHHLVIDSQDRILATGLAQGSSNVDFTLVRLLADGSLDATFGNGGIVQTDMGQNGPTGGRIEWSHSIAIQSDNRIVVAGRARKRGSGGTVLYRPALARYLPDGSLDTDAVTGFGPLSGGSRPGFVIDESLADQLLDPRYGALGILPDGRIVMGAGFAGDGWILLSYLPDGSKDTGFGVGGQVTFSPPGLSLVRLWDLTIQGSDIISGGRVVTVTNSFDTVVVRHVGSDGSLDTGFGIGGIAFTDIPDEDQGGSVTVDSSGRVVVAGAVGGAAEGRFVMRLDSDGSRDLTFGAGGLSQIALGVTFGFGIALDPLGDYVVAGGLGSGEPALVRYLGLGSPPPAAPTNLSATALSSSQIALAWTDNTSTEDGFEIERSTEGGPFTLIATTLPDATAFSDTGIAENTSHAYRVRAFIGAVSSAWSNTALAVTPPNGPPAAPSGLSASPVSSTQIDLGWIDNAGNEDGFDVERSPSASGAWSVVATLAADSQSYSDTGLQPSTAYDYRVSASNSAGSSALSNTATATTEAVPLAVTVAGITPSSMDVGSSVGVTVMGTGFQAGATVTFENGSGPSPSVSGVVVVDSTTIVATVSVGGGGPKGQRLWDVRVTNSNSSTDSLADGFTVIR